MIASLISIILMNFAPVFAADDCGRLDLNVNSKSPLRKMPVYDQDGSGTCYAHAATQLIDYWRISNGVSSSDRVNPLYAAWVDQHKYQKSTDTIGGHSSSVITNLKRNGYCKSSQLNSSLETFKKAGGNLSDAELIHYLEVLDRSYNKYFAKSPFTVKENAKKAILDVEKDDWVGGTRCKKLSDHMLQNYLTLAVSTSNSLLESLFKNCKPLQSLKNIPAPVSYNDISDSVLRSRVDQSLLKSKPVSISMCSGLFDKLSFRGLNSKNGVINGDQCGAHEVLITARRKFGESCQYMVRNSWGANWHPKNVKCACYRKDGIYEDRCSDPSKAREYVGCWYDQKDIMPNIYRVTTLYLIVSIASVFTATG